MAVSATERLIYAEYGRTLVIRPGEGEDAEALFERVCSEFDNTRIEQDSEGNVSIMPPTGGESSNQNVEITSQLAVWAKQDGRGRAFDSNVLFVLPDKSKLGPDGSWVSNEKLKTLTKPERRKFLRVIPDFIIELKSPSDRVSELEEKMQTWRQHGVEFGWLIHPDQEWVSIYRAGSLAVEKITNATQIEGDGPVAGFKLDLRPIWEGLEL